MLSQLSYSPGFGARYEAAVPVAYTTAPASELATKQQCP
jgi:hypothetical protein